MCDAGAVTDEKPLRNPLGPAGRHVCEAVKSRRLARGLTHEKLAELLRQAGRPIPVIGLSRIENGARRVDVDDLIVLADALATTPYELMYPMSETDPSDELRADEYIRNKEPIHRAIDAIIEVVQAGVPYGPVARFVINNTTLEMAKRGVRNPRHGER